MAHKLMGAEVFSTGTHNGLEFSDADLDGIVEAFAALESSSRIPLKFGHNNEQPFTDGQPALGWVERVWKDGGKLLADFVGLPEVVFNAIKGGLYKNVSIELLKDFSRSGDKIYPWVLDAVALLGADIPAVRGLKDLQALTMARALPGVRFAQSVAFTQVRNYGEKAKMPTIEELQAENAKLKAEAEAREKAIFTEKVTAHREAITAMLDKAVEENRVDGRVRDRVVKSRQFKADEDVMEFWTIDEVKGEITRGTRVEFSQGNNGGGTSKVSSNETSVDITGKTVAEVVTFKTQDECLRLKGDPRNPDDMRDATKRLFRMDPKLARAYFDTPHDIFKAE
jgi:hypothetical protein